MAKLLSFRKPKLRVSSKGVRVTKPSARIGGKVGANISSKGVSFSARTPIGTVSSRTGYTSGGTRRKGCKGCPLTMLMIVTPACGLVALLHYLLT